MIERNHHTINSCLKATLLLACSCVLPPTIEMAHAADLCGAGTSTLSGVVVSSDSCTLDAGESVTVTETGDITVSGNPTIDVVGNAGSIDIAGSLRRTTANQYTIHLQPGTELSGEIANAGSIVSEEGILLEGTVTGNIVNSGELYTEDDGITARAAMLSEGITNEGTIAADSEAIVVGTGSTIGGSGIINNGDLRTIASDTISLDDFVFLGVNITNNDYMYGNDDVIGMSNMDFGDGGIINNGTMVSNDDTIVINASSLGEVGIINNDTVRSGFYRISVSGNSVIEGTISNIGTMNTDRDTIRIHSSSTGGVNNSGHITSQDGDAIYLRSVTFVNGEIVNKRTINAANDGLYLNSTSIGESGIVNFGSIVSAEEAITIRSSSTIDGDLAARIHEV